MEFGLLLCHETALKLGGEVVGGGGHVELNAELSVGLDVSAKAASRLRVQECLLHFSVGSGAKFLPETLLK